MQFVFVPEAVWKLREDVAALGSPAYEEIVEEIYSEASVLKHKSEKAVDDGSLFRVVVSLKCSARLISLFHSARSGYRAQYYSSISLGEDANRFALRILVPRALALLTTQNKRACPLQWTEKSLLQPTAKVWIHQGRWVRLRRYADRGLSVPRWNAAQSDPDSDRRMKAVWAALTPMHEQLLELKGGFLSLSGEGGDIMKPDRSQDLHELGFT